jgi:hypothetical protein
LVDETSRIAGRPSLVLSARLPRRLLDLYQWSADDVERLRATRSPLVTARVIADDGTGGSVILHPSLEAPSRLLDLRQRWGERGPVLSMIAASCLIDRAWQEEWVKELRAAGRSIMLIDIELERFAGSWADEDVRAGLVEVNDPSGGRWAVAVSASNQPVLGLAVGDEITARLLLEQLQRTPAIRFTHATAHLDQWRDVLPIALTHLLATESFVDFNGLHGYL